MSVWRKLQYLVPSYRRAQERDMTEELASLASLAEPRELGNITRAAEDARATWQWMNLEQFLQDVQYALRAMRHSPGFTAAAVLSLALGIGANTAIFSLIDALMLRWLPVRDPQELVQVLMRATRAERATDTFSYSIARGLADQKDIFSGVTGFSGASFSVGPRRSVSRVPGAWVTGEYYDTFGLNPRMGRLLTPADDEPGSSLVAVISYDYWERRFAGDPAVIGASLAINGVPVTIAGVSPPGFVGANVGAIADITMAAAALPRIDPASAALLGPGNFWMRVLARPRRNISIAQTQARLAVVWPRMAERLISTGWPPARRQAMAQAALEVVPGGTGYTYLREVFQKPLMALMGVVALVLLIACANVANLLLARAAARQREIAVRLAIGAGRGRIIRQLLTESMLLSSLGGVLGICLAWFASSFLVDTLSLGGNSSGSPFRVALDLTPNWHVLVFTSAVAIATAILFGLAPAFQTTAAGPSAVAGNARMTRSRSRLLSALVSAQVALSLMLLVGAGLFVQTLRNLLDLDPGFRREGVLLVNVDGRQEGYRDARLAAFYRDLLDRVRRTPGVVSASIASHTPLSGSVWSEAAVPKGQPLPERDNAIFIAVGTNHFATMETPLISGREFSQYDVGSANVAIVNQTFAARHFPGQNPVGRYLSATVTRPPSDLEIVGLVKDAVTAGGLRAAPRPAVYVPYFQRAPSDATLEIRVAGSLPQAASAIRQELQPELPGAPIEVHTLTGQVERTLVQERLMANVAGGFGVLGLILACVGLYGLLAYGVERRTREIGVRMALGAGKSSVRWMVVKGALRLVVLGVALGLPAAWVASRWVKSMLFGLSATDPGAMAAAVLSLGAAALVAAYFPARRATRVDPMTALRHD